jgi:tellurite resistance protein
MTPYGTDHGAVAKFSAQLFRPDPKLRYGRPHVPSDAALASVLEAIADDILFVLADASRGAEAALQALLSRRAPAYEAIAKGEPQPRMASQFDAWFAALARAAAPVAPPASLPMMEVVREKVTLEIGARGLRGLFSSKPADKEVARVKRLGGLAVRVLRATFAADGPLDYDERTVLSAVVAALGLPQADAGTLLSELPLAAADIQIPSDVDRAIGRAIVRGAWLAATLDAIDPREEVVVQTVASKLGLKTEEVEAERRWAIDAVDARRDLGSAAVDAVRYVLSDRVPGLGVRFATDAGRMMLPKRWRDEAMAPLAQGVAPVLAKRHRGLEPSSRFAVLGIAWAAALADNPAVVRQAVLRSRWEQVAADLGEDDPLARETVERLMLETLATTAR